MQNVISPMMQQFREIRAQYPDCIVFFRLGDFYEMFFEDALVASRELELTLTGRECGGKQRAPMCGVPFHSYEGYLARLVKKGYKVAICEQMEDPSKAKGLVRREVIRVVTPGTVLDGPLLDEGLNNYLGSVYAADGVIGLCFIDISTGDLFCTQFAADPMDSKRKAISFADSDAERQLKIELGRFCPKELLLAEDWAEREAVMAYASERYGASCTTIEREQCDKAVCEQTVLHQFGKSELGELELFNRPYAVVAIGMLLHYVQRTQKEAAGRLISCNYYSSERYMTIDPQTKRNLELLETMRSGERVGSLLHVLDKTCTAMGKRRMRAVIERPLVDLPTILRRQDAVAELVGESYVRADLIELLGHVFDLERLMTKVQCGSGGPRDLRALSQTFSFLPPIKQALQKLTKSALLRQLEQEIDGLQDIADYIEKAIVESPPLNVADGGVIRAGFDELVDQYRDLESNARGYLAAMEAEEKEKTGIKNLRIAYNRVFGYAIEVTRSNAALVPERYIRRQTLANSERYVTPELKELEEKLMSAREKLIGREQELYENTRAFVAGMLPRIQTTAKAVAEIDLLCSFAQVSQENGYSRPALSVGHTLHITDGRHPVIEQLLSDSPFVSNDTRMDDGDNRVLILTGPNMAGKSTYMRQNALIVLMAQLGCFVPASSAEIGLCDAIFTRVGASDDLSTGQSTFMVEMNEVAHILRNATADSLILLDEIGRGTSTFDGMSIARAVVEFVADKKRIGSRTLFATHYHELTDLEDKLDGVKNYNIAAIKRADSITFLRKIVRGGADQSYGIEVAKLAGVPDPVIRRAKEILQQLEDGQPVEIREKRRRRREESSADAELQMAFLSERETKIVDLLTRINIETLTPIEALNRLYELVQLVK